MVLGLYAKAFEKVRKKILNPRPETQDKIMHCIHEIKARNMGAQVREELLRAAQELAEAGAQAILLGCTEVPLVLQDGDLPFPFIDPAQVVAEISVAMAQQGFQEEGDVFLLRQATHKSPGGGPEVVDFAVRLVYEGRPR